MAVKWIKSDHLCRSCFGRIYRSDGFAGARIWQCSNCGLESDQISVRALCVCGSTFKGGKNRGLRCRPNPKHQPGINGEIVVLTTDEIENDETDRMATG